MAISCVDVVFVLAAFLLISTKPASTVKCCVCSGLEACKRNNVQTCTKELADKTMNDLSRQYVLPRFVPEQSYDCFLFTDTQGSKQIVYKGCRFKNFEVCSIGVPLGPGYSSDITNIKACYTAIDNCKPRVVLSDDNQLKIENMGSINVEVGCETTYNCQTKKVLDEIILLTITFFAILFIEHFVL